MVSSSTTDSPQQSTPTTRIVGIGASAGGLVALERFLTQTPPDSGLAYIVVQHLDPTHKALLPELLQRFTTMPVYEAQQDMRIEPDAVYVIPPNTELSVNNRRLKLANPAVPRGMRLPINVLFSSLASAQGERAIAVILSGMGSDGTLGMQAIRAVGGLNVVQEPDSAQFDAMPKSAIAAGCADIVAPPGELPAHILAYVAQVPVPVAATDEKEETQTAAATAPLQNIVRLLQERTRHDFTMYKNSTLQRRIERRMTIHKIATLEMYAEFLRHNTQEIDLLFKELLIGVTSFFRDPEAWQYLADKALPELLSRRKSEPNLRAWVVGCSTGEEAYSLAMIFSEVTERLPRRDQFTLQIFASDLSPDAIAAARHGRYPLSISETVSPERLVRFFTLHNDYYQINKKIRDMVLFAQHDVVLDPPFTKLDLVACRNLLIYFDSELQRRLLPLFHYSLRSGGILFLGSSETVGRFSYLFTPMDARLRLYSRQDNVQISMPRTLLSTFPSPTRRTEEHPVSTTHINKPSTDNLQAAADHILLQVYAPAAVVLNSDGDIVYISGRTGKYLEPAAGKANWNFYAMLRDGLREPLAQAMKKVETQSEPEHLHGLKVSVPGGVQHVDITLQALHNPPALAGMTMVVFHDVSLAPTGKGKGKDKDARESAHEAVIQQYLQEIESLRNEARTSREELEITNEELQSTNEELQSANEELTTSKEEMQSMNEELQTINSELQAKLDDLSLAQSDMQNVLNSIDIAILFLDQDLNVRRYTDQAATIINLRESDIGRPLSDLTTSLEYPELHEDALTCLRTLLPTEKQVLSADNHWFAVRIIPYRRLDNVIDGVVITLMDITKTKNLEMKLRRKKKT
ncbi:chemotaxis protein CheB [Thiohalophilus thiocyanatoxydans]|uniref:protein-glutamate O-methyltransferase n=1 Tax=Thiohalophilus thiocyanatoxydans TaxID=381308 RepID=A0A4R8IWK5_9GAMM|nr:chemotaxis protein CheB [Thiohalophilus thiocyanatoxydans]TDY01763.1 two-component system CheB/CheR fusion protein [Thiohalophilus thiocyanatoxydans]